MESKYHFGNISSYEGGYAPSPYRETIAFYQDKIVCARIEGKQCKTIWCPRWDQTYRDKDAPSQNDPSHKKKPLGQIPAKGIISFHDNDFLPSGNPSLVLFNQQLHLLLPTQKEDKGASRLEHWRWEEGPQCWSRLLTLDETVNQCGVALCPLENKLHCTFKRDHDQNIYWRMFDREANRWTEASGIGESTNAPVALVAHQGALATFFATADDNQRVLYRVLPPQSNSWVRDGMLDDNYHVQGNEGIVGSSGPHGALLMWKSKSGPDYDSVRWKGQIMGYGIRQGGWQVLSATSLLREDLKLPGLAHSDKDDAMVGVWWDKDDALQYSIGVMPAPYYAVRPEMRSWMALIDGSQLISRVSIPGTHDSATRFVGVTESKFIKWLGSDAAKTAQTQDWTIEMQLAKGIRYFDLRVTGNLVCCHGPATCYTDDSKKTSLTLEMVLEEFYTFLERFPTEGLLVQIADDNDRHEGRSEEDIGDDIKKLTAKKPERWRLDHTTPRVDELRGRIQLLCRFKHRGPTPGIQVSWGGGDKGELQSHRQSNETGGIVVQDYYNVYYWYLDEKRAWITNLIETCQQATESDDQIFINFLSCAVHTQPRDSLGGIEFESDPITNPRTGAYGEVSSVWNPVSDFFGAPKPDYDDKGINPWFLTELEEYEDPKNHPVPQLGVTVLDFAGETPTMVSRIIKTNWPYRRFWRNWDTF